jgi:hypothetical protein
MKLSPKQQIVLNHLRNTGVGFTDAWYGFDARTVNSLVKKGLVERVNMSRFREDDREMVYWVEFRLAKTELTKALT